ncbi:MAG: inositol monophosphatase [Rhizobiaceae bacterium]|nr:inositol monophosphatase [Rhizobiaceae bacterium]
MTLARTEPVALAEDLADCAAAACKAGAYVHRHFGGLIRADHKSRHSDVVTEFDLGAEEIIRTALIKAYPASTVVGEEFGGAGESEIAWIVDPIDGTSNFAGGLPLYCISIGVVVRGELVAGVIYDPERDELFRGTAGGVTVNGRPAESRAGEDDRDCVCLMNFPYEARPLGATAMARYLDALKGFRAIRRLGSAALALAYVSAGRADVACEISTKPWDHAAGMALVLAAGGGLVCRLHDGSPATPLWKAERYIAHGRGFEPAQSTLDGILTLSPNPETAS